MNRRGFLGLGGATIAAIIGLSVNGGRNNEHKKADFGVCVCGSKKLWWADHSEPCAKGGLIVLHRPDGAQLKVDACADCGQLRTAHGPKGEPYAQYDATLGKFV